MSVKTIILASHGTTGARVAEDAALEFALANNTAIIHLYVVPEFWRGMRGDDWLNNNITQERFGDYIEEELAKEAKIEIDRLQEKVHKAGVSLKTQAKFGKPADCLISLCEEQEKDSQAIFMGMPRPKGEQGYNSRMKLEPLVHSLKTQLIIVPRQS